MASIETYGGPVTIFRELLLTDIGGVPIGDISDQLLDMSIQWSAGKDDEIAMRVDFVLKETLPLAAQNTFVSPRLEYHWADGNITRTPGGVFALMLPKKTISPFGVVATYSGRDLTWVLKNSTLFGNLNFPVGTNVGQAIEQVYRDAGLTNINVRKTSRTLDKARTFRRGDHRRGIANALAKTIGWYNAFMGLDGAMTTLPYRDWSTVEPVGIISRKVLIGEIEAVPSVEIVPNTVMATMKRSGQEPIVRYAFNRDPDSPISLQNIIPANRHITAQVTDSNVTTIADLEALAAKTLADLSTFYQQYSAKLKPDPKWMGIQQTIAVDPAVSVNGEPRDGRFHIKSWKANTNESSAPIEITFGKAVRYIEVESA